MKKAQETRLLLQIINGLYCLKEGIIVTDATTTELHECLYEKAIELQKRLKNDEPELIRTGPSSFMVKGALR